METQQKLVIVGCGMAAGKLIEELLFFEQSQTFEITVIGDEPQGNYDRMQLVTVLQQENSDALVMNSPRWFESHGVTAVLGERATLIDRNRHEVVTSGGRSIPYDRVVIATGSKPAIPKIVGAQIPGVFSFRNINDAERITEWIQDKNCIIVVGGGQTGLELADALNGLEKEVTVSHFVDCLMERNLNSKASYVLEKHLEKKGINFIKDNHIIGLEKDDDADLITAVFHDKSTLETECVVINCGISPRKELAEISGLETGRGVIVDERLATSDSNIFGLGECIEHAGHTYGRIVPIYEQARVLAQILVGMDARYDHSDAPLSRMKSDIPAVAIGKIEEDEEDEVVVYDNPRDLIYKKLILRDGRLLGAHLVGDALGSEAMGVYYASKLPLPKRLESLLFPGIQKPDSAPIAVYWPEDVTICDCNNVSCADIRAALGEVGRDVDAIAQKSRAGTSCGLCRGRIEGIVNNSYDIVVVGAGLGGLTAAARLAREGKRVLVLESHDRVGGYAASFTREGYTFDASLHNVGPYQGTLETIFRSLELDRKTDFIPFDVFQRVIFPDHDITIEKGLDLFAQKLKAHFPEEVAGIDGLFDEMRNVREGFEVIEKMTLDGGSDEKVSPMLAIKYPQFVELVFSTYDELLDKYITDPKLRGLVSNLWYYFGLPPSELAAILYSVPGVGYIEYGGGYIRGTAQRLSDALAEIIRDADGDIAVSTRVSRILTTDGRARGVLTDEGEVFYADIVLSNVGASNTFGGLIDEEEVPKKYRKKVRRLETSLSAIQLYLGLDCTPRELGMEEHSFAAFFTYDHEESYRQVVAGNYAETFFACMAHSSIDESLAPDGCGVLNIFSLDHIKNWEALSKSAYRRKKEVVTRVIVEKVSRFLPNLADHIVVSELATPRTMQRYTSNPEGTIFGPSQIVTQSGLNRLKPETPIEGLYLVGSSIYPGGGYASVISSGYRVANQILKI